MTRPNYRRRCKKVTVDKTSVCPVHTGQNTLVTLGSTHWAEHTGQHTLGRTHWAEHTGQHTLGRIHWSHKSVHTAAHTGQNTLSRIHWAHWSAHTGQNTSKGYCVLQSEHCPGSRWVPHVLTGSTWCYKTLSKTGTYKNIPR